MATPPSLVLWEGPSQLNGEEIVVVATGIRRRSRNRKTSKMIQTHLFRKDGKPTENAVAGLDECICGHCKHRPSGFNSCYVNLRVPVNVWRAYHRGSYQKFSPFRHLDLFRNRPIRFGTYGDPAAVPIGMWNMFAHVSSSWTGYTHQWEHCSDAYREILMASVDTHDEYDAAKAMGYRCFHVTPYGEPLKGKNVFTCPASNEMGKLTTCADCGACDGTQFGKRAECKDVTIQAHGMKKKRFVPLTINRKAA